MHRRPHLCDKRHCSGKAEKIAKEIARMNALNKQNDHNDGDQQPTDQTGTNFYFGRLAISFSGLDTKARERVEHESKLRCFRLRVD